MEADFCEKYFSAVSSAELFTRKLFFFLQICFASAFSFEIEVKIVFITNVWMRHLVLFCVFAHRNKVFHSIRLVF